MKTKEDRAQVLLVRMTRVALVAFGIAFLLFAATQAAQAQTYSLLQAFRGTYGTYPLANLISDPAGNLYGSTSSGGPGAWGEIFKIDPAGKETIVYSFTGHAGGGSPYGTLVRDSAGNLYTVVIDSGNKCLNLLYCGMVFKVDPAGNGTVLYEFALGGLTGFYPSGGLLMDAAGNLYGTTQFGGNIGGACGPNGCGVIFKLDPAGNETVLHAFSYADGALPNGSLIMDSAGNLYGAAYGGTRFCAAAAGCGVVFKVDPEGNETVLHTFTGGSDGALPGAPLYEDASGNLYGVGGSGGITGGQCATYGCGVIFKLDPAGNETVLYTFKGAPDGAGPMDNVTPDTAGSLYGVTSWGGNEGGPCLRSGPGCGVIFQPSPTGKETLLYSFAGLSDGKQPSTGLLLYKNDLFGTTLFGGALHTPACPTGCGVVFKLALQ